ncbi:putative ammonium transporter 2 [Ischnura elegans]|uniref:putative ammonium transporter 2 n=1 Tax=Ischnura elegans TaxID=197161 RepID=UPI001ED89B34|nr:putative ammonium transporter 2 [Ischnura elegans]
MQANDSLYTMTPPSVPTTARPDCGRGHQSGEHREEEGGMFDLTMEDSNWVLTSSFIIFTMQTGFGLLESGCVSMKNEVNIMMKNVVDVVLGGLTYWVFGFGLSFGNGPLTNPFVGVGDFMIDVLPKDQMAPTPLTIHTRNTTILHEELDMGPVFATFLFQLSFATTATTIVSGAMAERCNFKAYCLFSLMNTIVYCLPAGWVWGDHGFLRLLGVVDIAGSGPVHLIGGSSAFAAALMLGPRLGRYEDGLEALPLGSPVNAVMGLFVLWWGWLAFNSGSTFGVSGAKWEYAARAAVMTVLASFGGGIVGLILPLIVNRNSRNKQFYNIMDFINGILGSLVSITAGCFLYRAWESIIIGMVGGIIACFSMPYFDRIGVDDPVGASAVHGLASIWGVLSVGLFAENPFPLSTTSGRSGLLRGGGWYLLGVQALACVCLATWGFFVSVLILWVVNKIVPIRMNEHEELLGADLVEHMIRHSGAGVSRVLLTLEPLDPSLSDYNVTPIGLNTGHELYLDNYIAKRKRKQDMHSKMPRSGKVLHLGSPSQVYPASRLPVGRAGRLIMGNQLQKRQSVFVRNQDEGKKADDWLVDAFSKNEKDMEPKFAWVD